MADGVQVYDGDGDGSKDLASRRALDLAMYLVHEIPILVAALNVGVTNNEVIASVCFRLGGVCVMLRREDTQNLREALRDLTSAFRDIHQQTSSVMIRGGVNLLMDQAVHLANALDA